MKRRNCGPQPFAAIIKFLLLKQCVFIFDFNAVRDIIDEKLQSTQEDEEYKQETLKLCNVLKDEQCVFCELRFSHGRNPVILYCSHIVCMDCLYKVVHVLENESRCAECRAQITHILPLLFE